MQNRSTEASASSSLFFYERTFSVSFGICSTFKNSKQKFFFVVRHFQIFSGGKKLNGKIHTLKREVTICKPSIRQQAVPATIQYKEKLLFNNSSHSVYLTVYPTTIQQYFHRKQAKSLCIARKQWAVMVAGITWLHQA